MKDRSIVAITLSIVLAIFLVIAIPITNAHNKDLAKIDRFKAEVAVCQKANNPEHCILHLEGLRQCDSFYEAASLDCLRVEAERDKVVSH